MEGRRPPGRQIRLRPWHSNGAVQELFSGSGSRECSGTTQLFREKRHCLSAVKRLCLLAFIGAASGPIRSFRSVWIAPEQFINHGTYEDAGEQQGCFIRMRAFGLVGNALTPDMFIDVFQHLEKGNGWQPTPPKETLSRRDMPDQLLCARIVP
jgi:hypothetical protein